MTFEEFLQEVYKAKNTFPTWRMGQAYMNTLFRLRPDLADDISGTDADPFYSDDFISEFIRVVEKEW